MRFSDKFLRRQRRAHVKPSYLLPPVASEVVFHPSLRRAGELLAGKELQVGS